MKQLLTWIRGWWWGRGLLLESQEVIVGLLKQQDRLLQALVYCGSPRDAALRRLWLGPDGRPLEPSEAARAVLVDLGVTYEGRVTHMEIEGMTGKFEGEVTQRARLPRGGGR